MFLVSRPVERSQVTELMAHSLQLSHDGGECLSKQSFSCAHIHHTLIAIELWKQSLLSQCYFACFFSLERSADTYSKKELISIEYFLSKRLLLVRGVIISETLAPGILEPLILSIATNLLEDIELTEDIMVSSNVLPFKRIKKVLDLKILFNLKTPLSFNTSYHFSYNGEEILSGLVFKAGTTSADALHIVGDLIRIVADGSTEPCHSIQEGSICQA